MKEGIWWSIKISVRILCVVSRYVLKTDKDSSRIEFLGFDPLHFNRNIFAASTEIVSSMADTVMCEASQGKNRYDNLAVVVIMKFKQGNAWCLDNE